MSNRSLAAQTALLILLILFIASALRVFTAGAASPNTTMQRVTPITDYDPSIETPTPYVTPESAYPAPYPAPVYSTATSALPEITPTAKPTHHETKRNTCDEYTGITQAICNLLRGI